MELGIQGKKVLITGATRGIGRAIAEQCISEGASIAFCARHEAQVKEMVVSLSSAGAEVYGEVVDVADHDALRQWIGRAATQLGGIDIVIANPSAFGVGATEADWRMGYAVDLMGSIVTIESTLPYLEAAAQQSGEAAVLVIASVAAAETDMESAYGAYKAGLIHYAKGLARRLAPQAIRVNSLSPGTIFVEDGFWDNAQKYAPDIYHTYLGRNPMGRMGRAEEVANGALFLCSPVASFVTGTNLVVDGGLTARVSY